MNAASSPPLCFAQRDPCSPPLCFAQRDPCYARILAFPIDEGTPDLSFERRLARENAWDTDFARRVVVEYRRFVYLAMTAGHQVTPSDQVDQAWHLHLTYSRSYWERMCGELLGRPLHHGPTRGGAAEAVRFDAQYERTLAAYRTAFGEEPPADIWPPAAVRFGDDLHYARVNTARNWVVPKGVVKRIALFGVVGGAAVCATGCAAAANPLDLRGADFLWYFIPLLLLALAVGLVLRFALRGPGAQPGDDEPKLDWADAAYLAGREHRLTATALARLAARGHIRVSTDGKTLEPQGLPPAGMNAMEAEVYYALPLARDNRTALAATARAVWGAFEPRAAELSAEGYLMPGWRAFLSGCVSAVPLTAVAAYVGMPRLLHAIDTQQSRGYLTVTLVITGFACLILFVSALNRLSRRGAHVLNRMRAGTDPTVPATDAGSVGLSVALFGTGALAACGSAELAALATWYPHPTNGTGHAGCGTGCSSSGGGDGGGGGGCGGGGCGGCGGCGG